MEVTGTHNPRSTPQSRNQKRDTAQAVGELQEFATCQPALIGYVGLAVLFAGLWERVSF